MSRRNQLAIVFLFLITVLIGCGPNEEELAGQIVASVKETVEAIPTVTAYPTLTPFPTATAYPTLTPFPTATAYPTLTPFPTLTPVTADLENLYCNFGFCIKYPQDPILAIPSYATDFIREIVNELNTVDEGGYSWLTDDVLIFLNWYVNRSDSPKKRVENGLNNPNFTDIGEITEATINDVEVAYARYKASDSGFPYRLFSVWRCGDRLFTYSIRSEEDVDLIPVLESAMAGFACSDGSG